MISWLGFLHHLLAYMLDSAVETTACKDCAAFVKQILKQMQLE
jgi:hypothetical protein